MKQAQEESSDQMSLIKKFGALGFLFFFFKGIMWLTLPLIMAYFGFGSN